MSPGFVLCTPDALCHTVKSFIAQVRVLILNLSNYSTFLSKILLFIKWSIGISQSVFAVLGYFFVKFCKVFSKARVNSCLIMHLRLSCFGKDKLSVSNQKKQL